MALTKQQREKLLTWAAEGLRLAEINARAAQDDPPWDVTWHQLRTARATKAKRYRDLREAWEREALEEGLARRAVRLAAKMERHQLLRQVIEERGQADYMQAVEGGKTGLLVRDYKGQGFTPVYKVDAALLKEMRDLEREIATELGQWTEKKELAGPDGGPIAVSVTDLVGKIYGEEEEPATSDGE